MPDFIRQIGCSWLIIIISIGACSQIKVEVPKTKTLTPTINTNNDPNSWDQLYYYEDDEVEV